MNHILTVAKSDEWTPDHPHFNFSIECPNGSCGWIECRETHEVDGVSADDGPDDCEDDSPWYGYGDFVFHGVVHEWHIDAVWRVPYSGCAFRSNTAAETAHNFALEHGCGRFEVKDDWRYEEFVKLVYVRTLEKTE